MTMPLFLLFAVRATLVLGAADVPLPPSALATGDLVFVTPLLDGARPLDAAILDTGLATVEWLRAVARVNASSNITATHVALALRNRSGLFFVEAIPPSVTITPAAVFWAREPRSTTWQRGAVDLANRSVAASAVAVAAAQVGKPYATLFEPPSSGAFYCSSLVEYAFRAALAMPRVFVRERFVLIFQPRDFWEQYYASMGEALPVNASGSNPTLLLHSARVAVTAVGPRRAEA